MGKKVSIVFEESGGAPFTVQLEGLTPERRREIDAMTPEQQLRQLSPAEFWGLRCFQIAMHTMVQAGVVREVSSRSRS